MGRTPDFCVALCGKRGCELRCYCKYPKNKSGCYGKKGKHGKYGKCYCVECTQTNSYRCYDAYKIYECKPKKGHGKYCFCITCDDKYWEKKEKDRKEKERRERERKEWEKWERRERERKEREREERRRWEKYCADWEDYCDARREWDKYHDDCYDDCYDECRPRGGALKRSKSWSSGICVLLDCDDLDCIEYKEPKCRCDVCN